MGALPHCAPGMVVKLTREISLLVHHDRKSASPSNLKTAFGAVLLPAKKPGQAR